jgi:hypothetical protein
VKGTRSFDRPCHAAKNRTNPFAVIGKQPDLAALPEGLRTGNASSEAIYDLKTFRSHRPAAK